MALSIILVALGLIAFVILLSFLFVNLDHKHGTQSIPSPQPKRTIEQVIKNALRQPPLGCMWEVKRAIKNYRKAGERYVFDGAAELVLAEFKFITPKGTFAEFTLSLEEPVSFEQQLVNHVNMITNLYRKDSELESTTQDGGWDGIYN